MDDLAQVAALGLLKAIDGFDPRRGIAFRGYAVPTILGELRRHFRQTGWAMHLSRSLQERALTVRQSADELTVELGHHPTSREIADALSLEPTQVVEALATSSASQAVSLDETVAEAEDPLPMHEAVGDDDAGYSATEERLSIARALTELPERERVVLALRFFASMTQARRSPSG
jgi:RNA polymerase sigma-B factor